VKNPLRRRHIPILKNLVNGEGGRPRDGMGGQKLAFRITLAAVLIFGITFLYPIDKIYEPIQVPSIGEIAERDIKAPFDFPIMKSEEELSKDRELVMANLKPVLSYDPAVTQQSLKRMESFYDFADSLNSLKTDSATYLAAFKGQFLIPPDHIVSLLRNKTWLNSLREFSREALDSLFAAGIYPSLSNLPLEESGLVIVDREDGIQTIIREQIFDLEKARWYVTAKANSAFARRPALRSAARDITWLFLEPNLLFDRAKTDQNKNAELEAIRSEKGWVYKDQTIVRANERITKLHQDKLHSLAHHKRTRLFQSDLVQFLLPPLGRLFFVAFPILFFGMYLYYFRRAVFFSNSSLILFSILLAGLVIILEIVMTQEFLSGYLVPIAIASMLATIAFDLETGLFLTFSGALLMGILSGFKMDIAFVGFVAGTLATFAVRKVRHRHEFYRAIAYLSAVYFGVVYIIESLKLTPPGDLWREVGFGVINGFLSPILTIGLLPLFETTFRLTTDITLLELSDLNRPLLKRLAIEAPGTYHHSIMIGTLAEEAAKSISANSLLARVGSYYHDIGKMLKPEYFVENQTGGHNKHENLAPSMSALILEAHVKEGKELAEKNGLPDCIIEFITGHHGTTVMSYFYEKAKSQDGDNVDINEYRYPGPKPRSREVAIVMLADSVEAASRTLDDPKPARIKALVHKIISAKFESGELDDCEITMRELHQIEESFVRVLTGIFHRRVVYPESERTEIEV
jgi:putative nucleotidyltransferase with HDIG domain